MKDAPEKEDVEDNQEAEKEIEKEKETVDAPPKEEDNKNTIMNYFQYSFSLHFLCLITY